jgi:2-isopropylmalate synthase
MRAEDVGWSANKIVLGKLSGRNAFKARLQELGIALESEAEVNAAFARFKDLADRKSEIFDEDIMALVSAGEQDQESEVYRFVSMSQRSETGELPHARVTFSIDGKEHTCEATGDGPVDAMVNAIESQANSGADLILFSINAISNGTQSQGEVTMRLSRAGRMVNGVGADPDIVVASAKAYVSGLNKLQSKVERVNPQV